jgi:hypothetical protein
MAELILGVATLTAPVLFRFAAAGIVAAVVLGSLLIGMGVTISDDVRASLGWHRLCDVLVVLATAVAAFGLAVAGQPAAALFFAGLALFESGLNVATRYVTGP